MENQRHSKSQDYSSDSYNNMAFVSDDDLLNSADNDPGPGSESGVESIDNEDTFEEKEMLSFPKVDKSRKMSEISSKVMAQNARKFGLVEIRELIQSISQQNMVNLAQLQTLLSDRNFCSILFNLFDDKGQGILDQQSWFAKLKYWTEVRRCEHLQ